MVLEQQMLNELRSIVAQYPAEIGEISNLPAAIHTTQRLASIATHLAWFFQEAQCVMARAQMAEAFRAKAAESDEEGKPAYVQ